MPSLSTESTPRERIARLLTLMKRTRRFRRGALAIGVLGLGLALFVALHTRRSYRSETTVLYRGGLQTQAGEGESPAARVARIGPKLKDLLYARPELEMVVREHDLFPEKASRSMLDALEEMQTAVGFRARAGDSYVVSFTYDDAVVARDVAAHLAALMIDAYNRENLDTATLTRDFLRRQQSDAEAGVDESSRRLAQFLAEHPQFQWGLNDSPYAPLANGAPGAPAAIPRQRAPAGPAAGPPTGAAPADPVLGSLERELGRVEAELAPPKPAPPAGAHAAPSAAPSGAPSPRDAAAAEVTAAQQALAEKLLTVTPAHPDAVAAQARLAHARRALAAVDAALARSRVADPAPAAAEPLSPDRRSDLEHRLIALRRQIEGRREALGRGAPPAEAARPFAATPSAPAVPAGSADIVELETDWHRLRLDLDRAREKLHTIQQNTRAADLSADAVARQGHEEMQILEPAYVPTRPERGRGPVLVAGAVLALFLALGYAGARVLLDDTLLDEGDVAAVGGPLVLVAMPPLGAPPPPPPERAVIPAVRCNTDADDDPDDDAVSPAEPGAAPTPASQGLVVRAPAPIVEAVFDDPEVEVIGVDARPDGDARLGAAPPGALAALRILRARLEQRRGDGSFVVSVMSPGPGEGKTTLALRLAVTLSEADRARVILVEGHFARPRLAGALGLRLPPEAGFSAQIQERRRGRGVAWGIVRLGPSLSLLAEPGEVAAFPESIHATHFEAALAALRRSYEYVIIDGPAVVGCGDANVLEGASDAVLLLARAGVTRGAALCRATQQLGDRRVLGVVLNDAARG